MTPSDLKSIKEKISLMDVTSEDFFELVTLVMDKYYTFDKPDHYQKCLAMIYQWLSKDVPDKEHHVQVIATLVNELFMMNHNGNKSCTGSLQFAENTFFFDVYTSEVEKDKMYELLKKAHNSIENGEMTFAGQKKKGPMTNKFFGKGKKK